MAVDNQETTRLMSRLSVILRRYTHEGVVVGMSTSFSLQTLSSKVLIRHLRALIVASGVVSSVGDISVAWAEWVKLRLYVTIHPLRRSLRTSRPGLTSVHKLIWPLFRGVITCVKNLQLRYPTITPFKGTHRVSNLNMTGGARETKPCFHHWKISG